MTRKEMTYPVKFTTIPEGLGRVEAIVSVFGNVDLVGDRVVKGAFKKSIQEWKESDNQVPVVFSHDWGDMWSHIGVVDSLEETDEGLKATYTLDIDDNPAAAQVFRLMKRCTLKEHSFAYDVVREGAAKDGANELKELKIIEIGPTLKGANQETELLAVKSALEEGAAEAEAQIKDLPADGTMNYTVTTVAEVKAGRAISKANESKLRSAVAALQDILAALESEDEKDESQTPTPEGEKASDDGAQTDNGAASVASDQLLKLKAQIESLKT